MTDLSKIYYLLHINCQALEIVNLSTNVLILDHQFLVCWKMFTKILISSTKFSPYLQTINNVVEENIKKSSNSSYRDAINTPVQAREAPFASKPDTAISWDWTTIYAKS